MVGVLLRVGGVNPCKATVKQILVWVSRGQMNDHAAGADDDPTTDFQQLGSNGVTLAFFQFGSGKPYLAQLVHQYVGHRREPQPQLIRPHGGRAGTVGKQVELLLLDSVFHVVFDSPAAQ